MSNFIFNLVCLLVNNVLNSRWRAFSASFFSFTCNAQVRRRSMISPRYFTDWDEGIDISAKETSGHGVSLSVKVVCSDFDWLTLTYIIPIWH